MHAENLSKPLNVLGGPPRQGILHEHQWNIMFNLRKICYEHHKIIQCIQKVFIPFDFFPNVVTLRPYSKINKIK